MIVNWFKKENRLFCLFFGFVIFIALMIVADFASVICIDMPFRAYYNYDLCLYNSLMSLLSVFAVMVMIELMERTRNDSFRWASVFAGCLPGIVVMATIALIS